MTVTMDDKPKLIAAEINRLRSSKQFDHAINLLEQVFADERHNHRPDFWCIMGQTYCDMGELTEGQKWFDAVLAIDPKYVPALKGTIRVAMGLGDLERAEECQSKITFIQQGIQQASGNGWRAMSAKEAATAPHACGQTMGDKLGNLKLIPQH